MRHQVFRYRSVSVATIAFQACSFNHLQLGHDGHRGFSADSSPDLSLDKVMLQDVIRSKL